ncbi:HAUS augmin-like complex subunit 8 [Vanacampus margaritifer]
MASRRTTQTTSAIKSSAADTKSSKSGSGVNKTNRNATAKKLLHPASKSNGVVIPSRCTQAAERTFVSKGDSVSLPQRPSTPKDGTAKVKVGTSPRCSMGSPVFGLSNGKIVPSRYMQAAERSSLSKSNHHHNNDSGSLQHKFVSPKPSIAKCTPPRYSMGTPAFGASETSLLRKTVLQSTFSDGHCFRPDFDVSLIGGKTVPQNAEETESSHEEKKWLEMQALLLAFLTAKMAHNMAKLKPKVEARLLYMMEEEEALRSKVMEKKRRYLLAEKRRLANELLDMQISALTPAAEAAKLFTESYKTLASAVDITRHELPVKNFHIAGDSLEFLGKAEACLKESETLLKECTEGDHEENRAALNCLQDMTKASKDTSQQLSGVFSELLELSSLVSRHTVQVQQAVEEEQLGSARAAELFCPKR